MTEFIPGRKLNKKQREDIYTNIQPTLEKINKNLAKYAPLLSALDKTGILEGNFDKILREAETKHTSGLGEAFKNNKKNKGGSRKQSNDFKDIVMASYRKSGKK